MSTAVKRACDACHRRKVKCDGINPCRNCSSAQLSCTYNAIPQKKGPKGSRAKVISELRETQRQSGLSAKVHSRLNIMQSSVTAVGQNSRLLTNDTIKTCIDFFFENMFPSMPILNRQRLEQDAFAVDSTLNTYCLLSSLSAFMMLQPGISIHSSDPCGSDRVIGSTIVSSTLLLEETIRFRRGYDYLQNPNLYAIATSYFLFACYYGLDMHDKAWLSLREATSLVHLVRMNKEETYLAWDNVEASCRRRLYWLLFVAERAYALQQDRPLSLKGCINPPSSADEPSLPLSHQLVGFSRLVVMFRPFDDSFVELWNKTHSECAPSLIEALRKQHRDAIPTLVTSNPQLCDKSLNQRWLQALTWQINLSNGNTVSQANDMGNVPYSMLDVSHELVLMAASFSSQGNGNLLGTGLIETLITITSDLCDVLTLLPSSSNPFTASPRNYLGELFNILAMLRVGEHRFTPLLFAKVHDILPRLANPMLQRTPESTCEIDIFDGFGNAGMAQPPCHGMEEFKPEIPNSAVPTALHGVVSPFTPSSLLLSPGIDFDFTAVSDMAIHRPVIDSNITCVSQVESGSGGSQHTQPLTKNHVPLQMQQPYHHEQCLQHHLRQRYPYPQKYSPFHNQYLQQQNQERVPVIQDMGRDMNGNTTAGIRVNYGIYPPRKMVADRAADMADNLTSVFGDQNFGNSINDASRTTFDDTGLCLGQQSQLLGHYAMSSQPLRAVGDFEAYHISNRPSSTLSINYISNP